jgi:hypothetical protein
MINCCLHGKVAAKSFWLNGVTIPCQIFGCRQKKFSSYVQIFMISILFKRGEFDVAEYGDVYIPVYTSVCLIFFSKSKLF